MSDRSTERLDGRSRDGIDGSLEYRANHRSTMSQPECSPSYWCVCVLVDKRIVTQTNGSFLWCSAMTSGSEKNKQTRTKAENTTAHSPKHDDLSWPHKDKDKDKNGDDGNGNRNVEIGFTAHRGVGVAGSIRGTPGLYRGGRMQNTTGTMKSSEDEWMGISFVNDPASVCIAVEFTFTFNPIQSSRPSAHRLMHGLGFSFLFALLFRTNTVSSGQDSGATGWDRWDHLAGW